MFTPLSDNSAIHQPAAETAPQDQDLPKIDLMLHTPTRSLVDVETGAALSFFDTRWTVPLVEKVTNTLTWLTINEGTNTFDSRSVVAAIGDVVGSHESASRQASRRVIQAFIELGLVEVSDDDLAKTSKGRSLPHDAPMRLTANYSVSVSLERELSDEQQRAVNRKHNELKRHYATSRLREFERKHHINQRSAARILFGLTADPLEQDDTTPQTWTLGAQTLTPELGKLPMFNSEERVRLVELFDDNNPIQIESHREAIAILDTLLSSAAATELFGKPVVISNEHRNKLVEKCHSMLGDVRFYAAWGAWVHAGGLATGSRRPQVRQTTGTGDDTAQGVRFLLGRTAYGESKPTE